MNKAVVGLRALFGALGLVLLATASLAAAPARLRFEVALGDGVTSVPVSGRLLVVLASSSPPEPVKRLGDTGTDAAVTLGRDVADWKAGQPATLDATSAIFPIASLGELKPGEYVVQALLRCNQDLRVTDADGNMSSEPTRVQVDPSSDEPIKLTLSKKRDEKDAPVDTKFVKYIRVESPLLTKFWKRPISVRAAVILPRDFETETDHKYPLRVDIGGFATRYTAAKHFVDSPFSPTRKLWLADDTPRFVVLLLDGAGPLGDPYQVNSDNNGPFGDAITQELIPFVEKQFRCIGEPKARFLNGGSTGGWVSLALQVFYPDFFNGCWSISPDGVDFRAFELIDIYRDENAYVNRFGFERPSKRTLDGDVEFTVRHECQMENALGDGDSWTMSGQQWGAWNAVYGPRGDDGKPKPLWNPKTGVIDRSVVEHWRKYDLRNVLESNWATLGPKLRGKIHISVGEADDYFLNNGVVLLEKFLRAADPAFEGEIKYQPRAGHTWSAWSDLEMLQAMDARAH